MDQHKWDTRFLTLAEQVAGWSKDPSTKVGAVLVDDKNLIVGLGYNGFPRGVLDLPERYNDRATKYEIVVHAEVNAILMAGPKAEGSHLYTWPSFIIPPICARCCGVAIQAGVKEIIGYPPNENDERVKRWQDSILIARLMCNEAGVSYRVVTQ